MAPEDQLDEEAKNEAERIKKNRKTCNREDVIYETNKYAINSSILKQ